MLGVERPRVALLSVGEESGKGTSQLVEAHATLTEAEGLNFTGNVEGRDLLGDAADVIVTDGFTGNVVLKSLEGAARTVGSAVSDAARSNPMAAAGGLLLRPALGGLRREMDPDRHGWGDPAGPAWRRGGRPRQLEPGRHRECRAACGAGGRSAGGGAHRRSCWRTPGATRGRPAA